MQVHKHKKNPLLPKNKNKTKTKPNNSGSPDKNWSQADCTSHGHLHQWYMVKPLGERENIKQLFEFNDAGVSILFNWEEKKAVNKI